jgi:hypothetical protein
MRRTGPLRDRVRLKATRTLGVAAWRLGELCGADVPGAVEGPRLGTDPDRAAVFDELVARGGEVDTAACPYPVHELLDHLVRAHGLLLHGSNQAGLDVLEPRPARDWATELRAVVACDDGIWPIFYAVVDRARVPDVSTACMHLGRRRFYMFALAGDPAAAGSWTDGVVYALPRSGFRREWGREWVSPGPAGPLLEVPVGPGDFPLRSAVRTLPSRPPRTRRPGS